jgi:alkylation response protein AidB-like acyl-CoA dehydrogenase
MADYVADPGHSGYLTPERLMMQEMARNFTREEVTPVANRLDPEKGDIPQALIEKMGALGLFGITIPEEFGGLGLGAFEYCMVAEELARGWMSVASLIARGNSFYRVVPGTGEARRAKILAMAQGRYLGAMALSEPQTGSDLSSVACRARRDGDEWVITGNKYWCTFADGADFISVLCRIDDPVLPFPRLAILAGRPGSSISMRYGRRSSKGMRDRSDEVSRTLPRFWASRGPIRPRGRSVWRKRRWTMPLAMPRRGCSLAAQFRISRR